MYCKECFSRSLKIENVINEENYLVLLFFCRICEKEFNTCLYTIDELRKEKIKKIID